MELKAGFVGFGRMGITHFSILNNHPRVHAVALCDASGTMLDAVKNHLSLKIYSDYRKMLSEESLDMVIVSTPTESHAEVINAAIDRGVHVFSEKPFCLDLAEGEGILSRLSARPVVNQVGYVNRFNEVFMEVKKLLDAGIIGDLKHFSSEMYGATVLKDSGSSWRGRKSAGGGCMYEMASHCIDLAVYLFGKPDRVAGSVMQTVFSSEVEDLVSSTLVYNSGYCGTVHVNWSDASYRKPANIVKVFGTRGRIIADKHAFKVYLRQPQPEYRLSQGWNTRYLTDFAQGVRFYLRGNEFTRQLDYFVDHVEKGESENLASFAEALKTGAVMEEIVRDASAQPVCCEARSLAAAQKKERRSSLLQRLFG